MKPTVRWFTKAGTLAAAIFALAACSDVPTAPAPSAANTVASASLTARQPVQTFLTECGEYTEYCDSGGGTGSGGSASTSLKFFYVSNCNPYVNSLYCVGYCNPNSYCATYTEDQGYYELRQTLYEANGTGIQYNSQRWHSQGIMNVPIFNQSLCGTGRYINVEIYQIRMFNTLDRMTSFIVHSYDKNVVKNVGDGYSWSTRIAYDWTC